MSDTLYSRNIKQVVGTGDVCIELPAPTRGCVKRLVVVPQGSAAITAAVLYDRQDACDGVERSINPDDENISGLDPLVHQINSTITLSGGNVLEFGRDWCYLNQDEQHIHGRANSRIWLKLSVSTGGEMHIGYTIESRSPG